MTKIEITEESRELKRQLQKEPRGRLKERLQALYLLKTGQVQNALILKTLSHSFFSSITGKNRLLTELAFIKNNNLFTC